MDDDAMKLLLFELVIAVECKRTLADKRIARPIA